MKERIQVPAYLLEEALKKVFPHLWVICMLFPEVLQILSLFIVTDSIPYFVFPYARI